MQELREDTRNYGYEKISRHWQGEQNEEVLWMGRGGLRAAGVGGRGFAD